MDARHAQARRHRDGLVHGRDQHLAADLVDALHDPEQRRRSTPTETTPVASNIVTNELQVQPTIVKTVSATEAAPGDTLTYTLTVSNPGAAFTANVTRRRADGHHRSARAPVRRPCCSLVGNTVTWSGVTINPGTNTFTFDVTVTAGGGSTITNTGTLDPTSPDLDPIPSNAVETEIGPELGLVKLDNPTGPVAAGDDDHLHAGRQQRVERDGDRRRRDRRRAVGARLRELHAAGQPAASPAAW